MLDSRKYPRKVTHMYSPAGKQLNCEQPHKGKDKRKRSNLENSRKSDTTTKAEGIS